MLTSKLTRTLTQSLVPAVLMGIRNTMPRVWQYPPCHQTDWMCAAGNHYLSKYYIQ